MTPEHAIPAKAVQVVKIFRAHCRLPECGWRQDGRPWRGGEYATFAEAADERAAHVAWHREQRAREEREEREETGGA